MNLKSMNSVELTDRLNKLVKTERKITHLILECIAEIDVRKIYLARAYPSLYEFLVKEFGYSPSAAIRRIEGARLLQEVPEVAQQIEAGALNLSQLSQVQQAIRTVQKTELRKVNANEKRELLKKIEYSSQKNTNLILSQEWSLPVIAHEKEQIHRDESVSITIHLTKEEMSLLEELRNSMSHSIPSGKWSELFTTLAQQQIKKYHKSKIQKANQAEPSPIQWPLNDNIRKALLSQKHSCEYFDPLTEKKCGSQRFLQIDHIHPRWAGGTNELSNLQVLCASHNKFKYSQETQSPPLRR